MSDLHIPGVASYGDHDRRVTGSRHKPDRDGGRSRFEREQEAEHEDAHPSPAREEHPPMPHAADDGRDADPGDGTGQRINVTA